MYKCDNCGYVFDDPISWEEYRGECHGWPVWEGMWGCPRCRGGFEELDEIEESEDEE